MQHYRAVVIGGGIVGTSVLYHLAKLGWTDVALIERAELTAGSTWHAAAGFHALNADPSIAALQAYTIKLYREIEAETGMDLGLHMTGGVNIASAPDRWDWLQSAWAIFQSIGIESARLVTPEEIGELSPITDLKGLLGGLYDHNEGHLDPHAATHGFATAAQKRGAKVILRNRVISIARRCGKAFGNREIGFNAVLSMRLEKNFGLWSREFTRGYTPGDTGIHRLIAWDKGDLNGRATALAERDKASYRVVVTLERRHRARTRRVAGRSRARASCTVSSRPAVTATPSARALPW
jgi:dimethylglycine dehydrogenase